MKGLLLIYLKFVGAFTHQLTLCVAHSLYMKRDEDRQAYMCVINWSPGTTQTEYMAGYCSSCRAIMRGLFFILDTTRLTW